MWVGKDVEETEKHKHVVVKNNGQNTEYNSIQGCEVWGAKEKIKVIFCSRKLSDGT